MMDRNAITTLDWPKGDGLLPAIIQDDVTLRVIMLGYMNEEALRRTFETCKVTFFSRSRQCLWQKGETSGHWLQFCSAQMDCDRDTLLVRVLPAGPVCHTGEATCFGRLVTPDISELAELAKTIASRKLSFKEGSYTSQLFRSGLQRMAQKVGEEAVETALSAVSQDGHLAEEAADLLYHLFVLLEASGTPLGDVLKILKSRAEAK